jgi:hypothetical protein
MLPLSKKALAACSMIFRPLFRLPCEIFMTPWKSFAAEGY